MRSLPKLDERLTAIASMVREGVRCADIGCDHGYLIAWLAARGVISAGYACDINQKPLEKAAFTLSQYDVEDKVRLIQCNGLSGLSADDAQDIVIAGMGGELIWEIMDSQPWTRNKNLRFILQPMTKPERLRRSLAQNGFTIERESAAVSGDFPYSVMCVGYTGKRRELSAAEAWCGLLLESASPAAKFYIQKVTRLVREKTEGMQRAAHPVSNLKEYETLLNLLESRNQQ